MAISKMKKMTLAVMDTVKEPLIKELQMLGAVHIDSLSVDSEDNVESTKSWVTDLKAVTVDVTILEDQKKELSNAINKIAELEKMTPPQFEITSLDVINHVTSKYNIEKLASDFSILDKATKDSFAMISLLSNELDLVKKWSVSIDDMSPIHGTSTVLKGIAGYISESDFKTFINDLSEVSDLIDVIIGWVQDKEVYCYIIADPSIWEDVNMVLKSSTFNAVQITRRVGLVSDIIDDLSKEITEVTNIYHKARQEWQDYSTKLHDIALLHDYLEMEIQNNKARNFSLSTESVSFFRAWIPEEYMPKVEAILSIYNRSIDITIEDPIEEEYDTVPVLIKNNSLTRPFSVLTNMYGTPMYGKTVDPTPHLSIFYFIFYGICLGDALYGVGLTLFSSYMMFKNRANQSMFDFCALLAWSGVSAIIAGVLFGSYAGDLFSTYIPIPMLTDLRFTYNDGTSFFDKPLFVLFFSLCIGAIQLWYGYFLKFWVSFKTNKLEALCNEIPWLILLSGFFSWATLSWIAGMAEMQLVNTDTVALFFLMMKIGAGLIILNNIRLGFQKSFVAGFVGPLAGAWELYSISGYLSNLLSYARLLALGLSSGIIANVFNQLSFGMIDNLGAINPILSVFGIILLIFLHLFNLVLGGFGAFVHALRLQFVEFFGQFIEGGGKEFSPLILKGTHYIVK